MAQFDVYRNEDPASRRRAPFFVDVQSAILDDSTTRLVVPLILPSEIKVTIKRLNPSFEVHGRRVVLSTLELASVPRRFVEKPVASLAMHHIDIVAAIDFAFTGV
jgi:toxin CcdB